MAFFAFAANTAPAQDRLEIMAGPKAVSVREGDKQLLRYRYGDVAYKPYADRFFTPRGVNILRDSPHDHVHHHALMYAVKVDGVNFWEEQQAPGREQHRAFSNLHVDRRDDHDVATFTQLVDWVNPRKQELLLKERRTIDVPRIRELGASLLTWKSTLEPPPGKESVTLTGAHYHGLGMRFVTSMDAGGEFRNADGKKGEIVRGDERLVRSTWCAYTAKANGKDVTVAMFDHPDNERHPATWFTMGKSFAYLSATLNLHREPLKVVPDKPLVLQYGVALWDGRTETDTIDKLYRRWLTLPQPGTAGGSEQKQTP